MYCPSCGVNVTPGSSYCNYCGEKLSGAKSDRIIKSPEVRPETLVGAMVFAFVFGLGAITLLMGMMKAVLRLEVGVILAFALLSFLILLSLEGVFIRLLLRRKRGAEEAGDTVQLKGQATRELDAAQRRVLPEPMASVTEHTTRAFDPIYTEKSKK
jgi:predicted amidophosphoribosyltransferase